MSNESNLDVNVYFPCPPYSAIAGGGGDDLKITHSSNLSIVSADDYYPFGLTFNEYQNQEEEGNDFLYNDDVEREDDLGLNIDFTAFRNYDPALGRWWQIDPQQMRKY